jgi:hypothetical protein
MAVVRTVGDPNVVGRREVAALYGAVYPLKFALKKQGVDFAVEPLRARWPNAQTTAKEGWEGIWGLPIPEATRELTQRDSEVPVRIETWEYGPVAEALHVGPFATEGPTIAALRAFIADQGYEIAGPHEEEYLTLPTAKTPKTLIRYPIRPTAS